MGANSYLLLATIVMVSSEATYAQTDTIFQSQTDAWHEKRVLALKASDGWLNLAGLFWLREGDNRFGSAEDDEIIFPKGKIPVHAGVFRLQQGSVGIILPEGSPVLVNGLTVQESVVYDSASGFSAVMACGDLRWSIIRRLDKTGIRLRDVKHPNLEAFQIIERFEARRKYQIQARLERHPTPRLIPIENVLGQTNMMPSPGKLYFTLDNIPYSLDALREGNELFIIFGDDTNGYTTYPSGRFLYAAEPGPDGITTIDFNRAINPPCAFTPYATCPLPPRQNVLPIKIEAGEKSYYK